MEEVLLLIVAEADMAEVDVGWLGRHHIPLLSQPLELT
jgi:hypothetical protein